MKKIVNLLVCFALVSMVAISCEDKSGTTPGGENPDNGGGTEKPEAPKADFTYETTGLDVLFTNTSTGATAYLWDFGDESTSTEKSPSHTYDVAGEYTVTLTVSNSENVTAKKTETLTIAGAVKAYFSYKAQTDSEGGYGKVIHFDATSSVNPASIAWDFGDGTAIENGTEFKPVHEYADFGTYTVKATVTGEAGDTDTYETQVEVVAYSELLKGGSMELDDAQYWEFKENWTLDDDYAALVGTPAFVSEFGYKSTVPSGGEGGCLRLGGENQNHDGGYTADFYQEINVREGDVLEIRAQIKWGENTADNGGLYICIAESVDDFGSDASAVIRVFNYWGVVDTPKDGGERYGVFLPAYDGDLSGPDIEVSGFREGDGPIHSGYERTDEGEEEVESHSPVVTWTAPKTGTYYFGVHLTSVWGFGYGAGKDYYFDNLSVIVK